MTMFLLKFYTIQLVLFGGFLNNTYAMVNRTGKQQSVRSDRQLRPVLNSIFFLLAASLVTKGALGLGTYQTPTLPNNVQGSLFLTLNNPSTPLISPQQNSPLWNANQNYLPFSAQTPKPATQQVIHIRDSVYDDDEDYKNLKENTLQKIIVNRNRNNDDEDLLLPLSSDQKEISVKPNLIMKNNTEKATEIDASNNETESVFNDSFVKNDHSVEIARQATMNPTTIASTLMAATTNMPQAVTPNMMAGANKTNTTGYGYGPSNGYENVSITYGPPTVGNNTNATRSNNTNTGYHYIPSGNYGPSNGYENVAITYGPPVYHKPFFSSPEDPYLNHYNQYYNHMYYNSPSYYPELYKYNDFFNKFYNKYNYNNYPSFYNNYLGK